MYTKSKNIFFLVFFCSFIFLVVRYYFSEKNIIFTNKSRSEYSLRVQENQNYLPVLENDTNNIIVYKNDLEKFKKKRKKRFWEKLINNEE